MTALSSTDLTPQELRHSLKHYFGYDQFRAGQERVIEQVLRGRDVFVLMPTGGGKSLCYQLPALLQSGVTVVISPLIALMQDQVMGLQNNGIPATFLNSSLAMGEQRRREQQLLRGEYKLLYLAPERLVQAETWPWIERLHQRQGIVRWVVDEAHCISEWGHDFRPEYRQLDQVRGRLPQIPVTALTATATDRVRGDIVRQLDLTDPFEWVASFNRPNLYYGVQAKGRAQEAKQQVLQRVRAVESGATIIYCSSRAEVERLAEFLNHNQIPALPYHAGLAPEVREDHQTRFIRDQVQVMVATVAFGMGINKPDVRLVIHYDLPKTMEGYYQESGRAGRDGLPAECLLFYGAADRGKVEYMIAQKTDPQEQRIARQQLRQMEDYASSHLCRRRLILSYFSEDLSHLTCKNCDNCLHPAALEDRTIEAQKLLSCIARSGQRFGMRHVIDILRGSDRQRILQYGHDRLSTYGIGKDLSVKAWQSLGRALLQQGLIQESQDGFPVLSLTEDSLRVLKGELQVQVPQLEPKPLATPEISPQRTLVSEPDQELFQQLRSLRRTLADQRSVPPFMIFSDRTLTEMAQHKPQTADQFARLNGVGSRKLAQFGEIFLNAIQAYINASDPQPSETTSTEPEDPPEEIIPAQSVAQIAPLHPERPPSDLPSIEPDPSPTISAPAVKSLRPTSEPPQIPAPTYTLSSSHLQTLDLHQQGLTVDQIAQQRQLSPKTISGHLASLLAAGESVEIDQLVAPHRQRQIFKAIFALKSYDSLTSIREELGDDFSYEEIRFVRAALFQHP